MEMSGRAGEGFSPLAGQAVHIVRLVTDVPNGGKADVVITCLTDHVTPPFNFLLFLLTYLFFVWESNK